MADSGETEIAGIRTHLYSLQLKLGVAFVLSGGTDAVLVRDDLPELEGGQSWHSPQSNSSKPVEADWHYGCSSHFFLICDLHTVWFGDGAQNESGKVAV